MEKFIIEYMREQNSRETILKCALELFASKGYDAVGVSEIVAKAQITKPTLYYFFNSKEGLFEELLKENFRQFESCLRDTRRYVPNANNYFEDVYPVLLDIAGTFFTYAKNNSLFYMMLLSLSFSPPSSRPAIMAEPYQRALYEFFENVFTDISDYHTNLKGREQAFSWRFYANISTQIALWYRGSANLDDEAGQSIVTHFMHGIFS